MLPAIFLNRLINPLLFPLKEGIYLIKQVSSYKVVDHYGVLVVGKYLRDLGYDSDSPIVFHLMNNGRLEIDWFDEYSNWQYIKMVPYSETSIAMARLIYASRDTSYDLFSNNCEQFARYVVEGNKQSSQVQNFGLLAIAGIGAVIYSNWNDER